MSSATSESKRVAIVTGAAEGIGRGIALRLAKDGYDLGLFDLPRAEQKLTAVAEEIRSTYGARVSTVYGDVSQEEDVKRLVDTVVQELGSLYAMIANAGICINRALHETTTEQSDKLLDINVKGTFYSFKYAAIQLIKQGKGGRLVGASSIAGKRGFAEHAMYCASKFAVRGIIQCAALDYGEHGITVNAYAPGACDTALLAGVDEYFSERKGQPKGSYMEVFSTGSALKRLAQPRDIANLVSFFLSDDAGFVTGQTWLVDGGSVFD
ncbi:acetoin dehydrogenase [Trametes sanguinea]|nr:acetoin dehydrogenase [Trametes sanguinea]